MVLVLPPQPDLRTARLWLTPFTSADVPAVYAYASDPMVTRYVTWPAHQSLADAETFLASLAQQPDTHCWALRLTPVGPAEGAIELSLDAPGVAAVHYVLARPLWGRGPATEALTAIVAWAFETLPELREIRTWVAQANPASRRVLEKCGFALLGVEEHHREKLPEPIAMCIYSRRREVGLTVPRHN